MLFAKNDANRQPTAKQTYQSDNGAHASFTIAMLNCVKVVCVYVIYS